MSDGRLGASAPQGERERDVASDEGLARRDALKVIGVAGGLLAAHAVLPRSWTSPLVVVSRLPAHAATSTECATNNQGVGADAHLTARRNADGSVVLSWDGQARLAHVRRLTVGATAPSLLAHVDAGVGTYLDLTARNDETYDYWLSGDGVCVRKVTVEKGK